MPPLRRFLEVGATVRFNCSLQTGQLVALHTESTGTWYRKCDQVVELLLIGVLDFNYIESKLNQFNLQAIDAPETAKGPKAVEL